MKRGSELHGPKEPTVIPAREILFFENMSENGQVATAIRRFKAGELPLATPPAVTGAPTSPRPSPSPTR